MADDKSDKDDDKSKQGGDQGGADKKDDGEKKRTSIWPWIIAGVVVLLFVLVVLWIILAPHPRQKTDDAYVTAHFATIAPRVAGQVVVVSVTDNQPVRAGQLLVQLDDRDFRTALAQAQATLAGDQARAAEAEAEVARQPSQIRQAEAQVASANARLGLSNADATRYTNLAATGAGTVQQHQQADTTVRQDRASLQSASAELTSQQRQLDALLATLRATKDKLAADAAQVDQARLNLSYTRVVAPIDGQVDQRQVQVGNYVSPGAPVMVVAPLREVYVVANYRELALRHMRPGQPVRIHLDAYDVDLDGIVDSLPAASGAAYSPIPATNATGNFTKIVQRLPVKIVFRPGQPLARLVRVGMSVETTVDTRLEDVVGEQRRYDSRVTGMR
jgi:membrane fusion protein (multidrug efflux system)